MMRQSLLPDPDRSFPNSPESTAPRYWLFIVGFSMALGVLPVWPMAGKPVPRSTVWITLPPPNPFEEELRKRKLSAKKFRWPRPQ